MNWKRQTFERILLATAIGLVATFAAPWVELRGTFAAWRISEWHTFWRGDHAFLLADVVAANFPVPIEYATVEMETTLRALFWLGSLIGGWHLVAFAALLRVGARMRLQTGAPRARVALEIIALVIGNLVLVYALALLLALPSTLAPKVDFRTSADIHTDSLIWSSITILPIAPALALVALIAQPIIILTQKNRNPNPLNRQERKEPSI